MRRGLASVRSPAQGLRHVLSTWGWGPPPPAAVGACDPAPVRAAMRQLMAGATGIQADRLLLGIAVAQDLGGLWHLRGGLMQALAARVGEAQARRHIAELDAVFLQAWPQAPVSRNRLPG